MFEGHVDAFASMMGRTGDACRNGSILATVTSKNWARRCCLFSCLIAASISCQSCFMGKGPYPLSRLGGAGVGRGWLSTPRPLHRRCRAAEVGWTGTSARSSLLEAVCPLLCSAQLLLAPHPRARATKGAGVGERLLCRCRRPNPPQMPLLRIARHCCAAATHGDRACGTNSGITRVWRPIRAPVWLLLTSSPPPQARRPWLRAGRQVVRSDRPGLARFAGAGALDTRRAGRKPREKPGEGGGRPPQWLPGRFMRAS